jgi:hypothetical protein
MGDVQVWVLERAPVLVQAQEFTQDRVQQRVQVRGQTPEEVQRQVQMLGAATIATAKVSRLLTPSRMQGSASSAAKTPAACSARQLSQQ